jgi:hypothetical protein
VSFGGRDGIWAVERCGKSEAEVWRMNLLLDLENNGNGEKFGSVTWGNVLHVISLFDAIITAFSFGSETNSEKVIKLFN